MATCEVLIPVGPGHESMADGAADSVQMAEIFSRGPFDAIQVRPIDDTAAQRGRSAARNFGLSESVADWIFWLDADDVMLPEAFKAAEPYVDTYDAIWGKFAQLDGQYILDRYQAYGFSTYEDLLKLHPMCSIKIGHFVKREVALAHPFSTTMDCGEDWDYYLRVWQSVKCIKHSEPTYAKRSGRQSTGPRSATGKKWKEVVYALIEQARKDAGLI
jgi:glycosyltransferase involved in cell wall biosynthesis